MTTELDMQGGPKVPAFTGQHLFIQILFTEHLPRANQCLDE